MWFLENLTENRDYLVTKLNPVTIGRQKFSHAPRVEQLRNSKKRFVLTGLQYIENVRYVFYLKITNHVSM